MIITPADRLQHVEEYYFSSKLAEIKQMNLRGLDVINLGIGSPDLPPHQEVIDLLTHTAQQTNSHAYQSYVGIDELREAMSEWYEQVYQVRLSPNGEVLPLMGSKEGIMHISMAFLNPGDGVLVPNPGYPTYLSVARLVHARVLPYLLDEQNDWEPDWEQLEQIDLSGVKLMWVNYPNMPTGAKATAAVFERLVSFAHRHHILVVNDNPYSLILNGTPRSILQTPGAMEVALELNSLSKSHHIAGWRVGMLLGRADYLRCVLQVKSNMDSGMFLGIQKAAAFAMRHCREDWHVEQNGHYEKRLELAKQIATLLDCSLPSEGNGLFLWVKAPDRVEDVGQWADELLYNHRVFITPGMVFGSAGARYLRLSLCCTENRLREAFVRLGGKL